MNNDRRHFRMVTMIRHVPCTPDELADHLRTLHDNPTDGRWQVVSELRYSISWEYAGPPPITDMEVQRLWHDVEELRAGLSSLIVRLARMYDDQYLDEICEFIEATPRLPEEP